MDRREILKYTALLTGSAICAPLMNSLLTGCVPTREDGSTGYEPQFFNEDQFKLLRELADTILPKTDSPAASEVGVHETIDLIVANVYKKEQQEDYRSTFAALEKYLSEKNFLGLDQDGKGQLLMSLDHSQGEAVYRAFLHLKQQTVAFYLSTEEIAENYLNYLPVPGEYEHCISLSDVGGKAWAI